MFRQHVRHALDAHPVLMDALYAQVRVQQIAHHRDVLVLARQLVEHVLHVKIHVRDSVRDAVPLVQILVSILVQAAHITVLPAADVLEDATQVVIQHVIQHVLVHVPPATVAVPAADVTARVALDVTQPVMPAHIV